MTLLKAFLEIVRGWHVVFPQERSSLRAIRQAMGSLVCLGRRTVSRIIWTNGGEQQSWSAEYFLHSRCRWDPQQLFTPVLEHALPFCTGRYIGVAADDTRLHKTGRCIQQAFYQRDPLSPPFHVNLMLGLRFLQASLLVPLHRRSRIGTRALPIRFQEASRVKRPGRKATMEEWKCYRAAVRQYNLSQKFVSMMKDLRLALSVAGASAKILVMVVDGSFCNRTVFGSSADKTEIIARARKDAVLCFRAPVGSRRFYDTQKFTPESVRQNDSLPWNTTKIFYGGKRRRVRYKLVSEIYWQGGARRRPLRLLVVAPTPYRKRKSGRLYYRQPGFLLTTDLKGSACTLLQLYFDRWQIEVNHREEKDTIGVGQAQLWNEVSVPKQPVLAVASYSALLLASLLAFGAERGAVYAPLPRWRKNAKRPSCLDLIALLRKEMVERPDLTADLHMEITAERLAAAAAA
jgi:DDE superfamily endonuclease